MPDALPARQHAVTLTKISSPLDGSAHWSAQKLHGSVGLRTCFEKQVVAAFWHAEKTAADFPPPAADDRK